MMPIMLNIQFYLLFTLAGLPQSRKNYEKSCKTKKKENSGNLIQKLS